MCPALKSSILQTTLYLTKYKHEENYYRKTKLNKTYPHILKIRQIIVLRRNQKGIKDEYISSTVEIVWDI